MAPEQLDGESEEKRRRRKRAEIQPGRIGEIQVGNKDLTYAEMQSDKKKEQRGSVCGKEKLQKAGALLGAVIAKFIVLMLEKAYVTHHWLDFQFVCPV